MSRPGVPHPDDARLRLAERHSDDRSEASSSLSESFDINISDFDARLKLKKRIKAVRLGANCTFDCPRENGADKVDWTFTLRPAFPQQNLATKVLNKFAVQPSEAKVRWNMGTLNWRFVKLKLEGNYDWETKAFGYNYRVMTALHNDSDSAFHKRTVAWNNRAKVQPRFDYDLNFPSLQGGNQSNRKVEPFMMRFHVKTVDAVVNLDRRPDSFFRKRRGPTFNPLGPLGEPDAKVQIITLGKAAKPAQADPDVVVRPMQSQEVVVTVKDKGISPDSPAPTPLPPPPATATPAPAPLPDSAPIRPILSPDGKGDIKRRFWDPVQRFVEEHPAKFVKEQSRKLPWVNAKE